jgi:hypothetical protein
MLDLAIIGPHDEVVRYVHNLGFYLSGDCWLA